MNKGFLRKVIKMMCQTPEIKELTQAQALQKESRERKEDAGIKNNVKNKAKNDAEVRTACNS